MGSNGINLKSIPGALKSGIKWMVTTGTPTADEAKGLAQVLVEHVKKLNAQCEAGASPKKKKRDKSI
ncbi:MAG: hypothetical protein BWX88_02583 [Planctomycetes bacterium ADurb.Bin126]|nr:MAG: hypothetical protein BWX88_02583 [Planctomycetes bacterium ADurb.Bin126]HOD80097.1 hypothetical protein [Phycisphaerae bacterium]HQL74487.1 hypothetical protein [Phycisphaerae bacterium]